MKLKRFFLFILLGAGLFLPLHSGAMEGPLQLQAEKNEATPLHQDDWNDIFAFSAREGLPNTSIETGFNFINSSSTNDRQQLRTLVIREFLKKQIIKNKTIVLSAKLAKSISIKISNNLYTIGLGLMRC